MFSHAAQQYLSLHRALHFIADGPGFQCERRYAGDETVPEKQVSKHSGRGKPVRIRQFGQIRLFPCSPAKVFCAASNIESHFPHERAHTVV